MAHLPERASALSVCLRLTHAISQTRKLDDICMAALDALEAGLGVPRASILLFDPDGVMRFKAWRGISDAYRAAVEGHTPWRPGDRNATAIVVPDVGNDPGLAPYIETIRAERIAAMAFIPLEGVDGVLGKFMLYDDRPRAFTADELELARIIAAQITFAVERARGLDAAQSSEERLRYALDAASMGTWDWDLKGESVQWSDNMERIHGLAPGSFDGTFASYEREIHPDDREKVRASIRRALSEGVPHDVEYRIVAPDGTVRWVEGKGRLDSSGGVPTRMTGVCMNITPRKEAELAHLAALEDAHRTAQRLAAIVQSSDDAIVGKDLNGIIMSWNRGAELMFGYSASEAVGRSILLIVPDDRRHEEDLVLARIRSGEPVEMETVRRRGDGAYIDISLKVSPIRDSDGRIVGASKIARDITARKRSELERAELERRLTLLVEASASLLDAPEARAVRSRTISLARQLLVADGYAVWASGPGQTGWRVITSAGISDEFASRVIDSYRGAPAPAAPLFAEPLAVSDVAAQPMFEERLDAYRAEGIRSMLVCPMSFGPGQSGTLVFYYRTPTTFSDIDIQTGKALANLAAAAMTTADLYGQQQEQRRAAESARRHSAFLADATTLLSQSLDYEQTLAAVARLAVPEIADWCAVDIVDRTGGLQRLAVAHVDPEKIKYAQMLEERYPADPSAPGGVHEVIRSGRATMLETIPADRVAASARDDEHRRILEQLALSSYMCVPLGSVRGTTGAMTFVMAESGRHYMAGDLVFAQDLAARASMAIENAVAYRRAYDANRMKDEFLATLSHELRTPLNAILGYAQMLSMNVLTEEQRDEAVTVLTRNARGLSQIIDDVLEVSRITAGQLRLNVAPISLADVIRNAVATMQPAADAKGIALEIAIESDPMPVSGDADRLQQVVWNLISNAVKFTPRGGHVQVRLERVGSSVQISVSDDGQGIDAEFLPHVFERFRQADSSFSRMHGGLGLGLAIVRDLVELHGGSVSASSDGPGTGATFRVMLPPMSAHADVLTSDRKMFAVLDVAVGMGLSDQLKHVRVLAVDDEEDALGLLRVILESAQAVVTTATSGARALQLLQDRTYDILISDVGMPGMNGLELIRTIRQLGGTAARIPAVALTAYARSDDRVTALANGFQMHIAKPVNPAELVTSTAALVGQSARAAGDTMPPAGDSPGHQ